MGRSPLVKYVTTRRELAEMVREHAGVSQQVADQHIDAALGAIHIWMLGAVLGLPENCECRLLVSGFGSFRVTVMRRGRRNFKRLEAGQVSQPSPTVKVAFQPCESILWNCAI